ncbi:MFS transporter [uncultured Jatrophihabitans sp.]|uniref:MFS transporter n=1 Tax=uncultured Jatrophihabitans sp. TaxID=1610747 RepID=UPI0035CB11F3
MTEPTAADQPRSIFAPEVRATSVGLLILITLIAFESMAVSAALPTAARDLHGLGSYGWAFTGFLIASVVGMVAAGEQTDRRGPAAPLTAGLIAFVAGLLLAGSATTMVQLIAGRVVQGLGGGLMITAAYVVIGEAFADSLRPKLFAAISSAWVLPSLLGPVISGLLSQHASWRWVFLGLVPFSVAGGLLLLPELRAMARRSAQAGMAAAPRRSGRLGHAVAVALGIAALEYTAQHPSLLLVALAVAGIALMVWGLRPLLPPGTVRVAPGVSAPIALRGLLAGSLFGVEALVPLSLTVQHGYSATAAGLPLTASGVTWAFGSWWQGRAVEHDGTRRRVVLIRTGFGCIAFAAAAMTVVALQATPGWLAYPAWTVAGLGAGLAMASLGVLLLRFTTDETRGSDSAALQLSDATAGALTTGLAGMVVAAAARGTISHTTAFITQDLVMCVVAGLGVMLAARARPRVAAEHAAPAIDRLRA